MDVDFKKEGKELNSPGEKKKEIYRGNIRPPNLEHWNKPPKVLASQRDKLWEIR